MSTPRLTVTIDELAALTGVSRNTWFESVKRGDCPLPTIRVGRRIVIPRAAVEQLLGAPVPAEPAETARDGR